MPEKRLEWSRCWRTLLSIQYESNCTHGVRVFMFFRCFKSEESRRLTTSQSQYIDSYRWKTLTSCIPSISTDIKRSSSLAPCPPPKASPTSLTASEYFASARGFKCTYCSFNERYPRAAAVVAEDRGSVELACEYILGSSSVKYPGTCGRRCESRKQTASCSGHCKIVGNDVCFVGFTRQSSGCVDDFFWHSREVNALLLPGAGSGRGSSSNRHDPLLRRRISIALLSTKAVSSRNFSKPRQRKPAFLHL